METPRPPPLLLPLLTHDYPIAIKVIKGIWAVFLPSFKQVGLRFKEMRGGRDEERRPMEQD